MLSRLLVGSQLTMSIALIVVTVSITLGALIGIISGYLGGLADHWIQRGVEFFLAVPEVPFYFALVAIVPRNLSPFQLVLVICAILSTLRWAHLAREVRGKTLSIVAARLCLGRRGGRRRALAHRGPPHPAERDEPRGRRDDAAHPVDHPDRELPVVPRARRAAADDQLGAAPQRRPEHPEPRLLPWVLAPVVGVLIAVMSFNMLGDGLRDAIDPYQH